MNARARALTVGNVIVAVVLSPHSEAMARCAAAFAEPYGALINLVHVCPMGPAKQFVTAEGHTATEWRHQVAQEALSGLAQCIRDTYPDCDAVVLADEPSLRRKVSPPVGPPCASGSDRSL